MQLHWQASAPVVVLRALLHQRVSYVDSAYHLYQWWGRILAPAGRRGCVAGPSYGSSGTGGPCV